MFLAKNLQQLGLSEKEAKVYAALLELGQANAQEISAKSGVNRATTYVLLDSLLDRKLVANITKENKAYYLIENPLRILDMLYDEKSLTDYKIGIAKKMMPELEMMERMTKQKIKIRFFEGREGIKLIQKDVAKACVRCTVNIFNINISLKNFPVSPKDHRQVYHDKRYRQTKVIIVYNPKEPIPNLPLLPRELRRYLPADKFYFSCDFCLYNNKLAMVSELQGIVIENEEITKSFQTLFELAWIASEKYQSLSGSKLKKKK